MKHIDIFTGIGGWPLGMSWAFEDKHEPLVFCEQDKFCQKVLKKHWPNVPIIDDVFNFNARDYEKIDILTCSPPCQPYSQAGRRKGSKDDRALWPRVVKIIQDFPQPPQWVCIENVRGLLSIEQGMAIENMLSDLESVGYWVQTFLIPACAVNAPHRRDRVWIVGHSRSIKSVAPNSRHQRLQGGERTGTHEKRQAAYGPAPERNSAWDEPWIEAATRFCGIHDGVPDRAHRLRALGNAVVPQIPYIIGKYIKDVS